MSVLLRAAVPAVRKLPLRAAASVGQLYIPSLLLLLPEEVFKREIWKCEAGLVLHRNGIKPPRCFFKLRLSDLTQVEAAANILAIGFPARIDSDTLVPIDRNTVRKVDTLVQAFCGDKNNCMMHLIGKLAFKDETNTRRIVYR